MDHRTPRHSTRVETTDRLLVGLFLRRRVLLCVERVKVEARAEVLCVHHPTARRVRQPTTSTRTHAQSDCHSVTPTEGWATYLGERAHAPVAAALQRLELGDKNARRSVVRPPQATGPRHLRCRRVAEPRLARPHDRRQLPRDSEDAVEGVRDLSALREREGRYGGDPLLSVSATRARSTHTPHSTSLLVVSRKQQLSAVTTKDSCACRSSERLLADRTRLSSSVHAVRSTCVGQDDTTHPQLPSTTKGLSHQQRNQTHRRPERLAERADERPRLEEDVVAELKQLSVGAARSSGRLACAHPRVAELDTREA